MPVSELEPKSARTGDWVFPKVGQMQRPFYLSLGMSLSAMGWFWNQHNTTKDDIQAIENRVVALEALEIREELKALNAKLDTRFDELRNMLDDRTRRRR